MDVRHTVMIAMTAAEPSERQVAFDRIVESFQDMALGFALSQLGDRDLAADVAQEAFVTAWRKLGDLREPAAFPGWFRQIVASECRVARRRPQVVLAENEHIGPSHEQSDVDLHERVVRRERRRQIQEAVAALPEAERIVTALFYIGEYTSREVALFLGLPETTIKKRLHAARRKLKQTLLATIKDDLREMRLSSDEAFAKRVRLMNAAESGDVDLVRAMLSENELAAGPEGQTRWRTPLHAAAAKGHADVVALLLENGANPMARDTSDNATPLHWAAENGHLDVVATLIQHGADVNANDDSHELGPLGWATVWELRRDVAECLLRHGAVHTIFTALAMSDADAVRALVAKDATVLASRMSRQEKAKSPLEFAIEKARLDHVDLLLSLGAVGYTRAEAELIIAAKNGDRDGIERIARADRGTVQAAGGKALILAAAAGHADAVRLLSQYGSDINEKDGSGTAALHRASWDNHIEVARVLVEAGAELHICDDHYGASPLDWADQNRQARMIEFWDMVYLLEKCGAPLTKREPAEESVLAMAEKVIQTGKGYPELVAAIEERGGRQTVHLAMAFDQEEQVRRYLDGAPSILENSDPPLLLHAIRWKRPRLVEYLLQRGADPEVRTPWGATALFAASESRCRSVRPDDVEIVRLLLRYGARVEGVVDGSGEGTIHIAVYGGSAEIVELLAMAGADLTRPDKNGDTPLDIAEREDAEEIKRVLVRYSK